MFKMPKWLVRLYGELTFFKILMALGIAGTLYFVLLPLFAILKHPDIQETGEKGNLKSYRRVKIAAENEAPSQSQTAQSSLQISNTDVPSLPGVPIKKKERGSVEVLVPENAYKILGSSGLQFIHKKNPKVFSRIVNQPEHPQNYMRVLLTAISAPDIQETIRLFAKLSNGKDFEKNFNDSVKDRGCTPCSGCALCREFYRGVFLLLKGDASSAEKKLQWVLQQDKNDPEAKKWLEYVRSGNTAQTPRDK